MMQMLIASSKEAMRYCLSSDPRKPWLSFFKNIVSLGAFGALLSKASSLKCLVKCLLGELTASPSLSLDCYYTGMDLRTEEACEQTFREIDAVVGLKYLKVGSPTPAN